ncbi:hypothetical protein CYMTET_33834 [Cymbomonas tetramitiformis]|uniref:Uncharacterized protein n=1 Tax=Cymbomonas tetramitiformis TaxID=36881 RepID=A0AAE0FC91_9CHLO|nr:hypothetical protein CYMTET_33834 [Cymbomonas tetramitiformis]
MPKKYGNGSGQFEHTPEAYYPVAADVDGVELVALVGQTCGMPQAVRDESEGCTVTHAVRLGERWKTNSFRVRWYSAYLKSTKIQQFSNFFARDWAKDVDAMFVGQ